MLSRLAGRSYRLVVDRLTSAGVRRDHYAILAALEEFGPVSQATLARRLGIDRSDVVAVLNDLERDGLALRAPDTHDRRRNAITITTAGSRTLRSLDDLVDEAQGALLEPLSATERRQFSDLLQRLVEHHLAPADNCIAADDTTGQGRPGSPSP
jgi:MarR family transcriptional regulator, lower aerobic nicotinate degradation pathway regulator